MTENSITLAEETVLKLKQLELKFENLQTDLKMSDCCFNELEADQEEAGNKIDSLEKRVTQFEIDLQSQYELFEERVATLKLQNVELRNHINLLIDMVNNITSVLNGNIEQADQVDEVEQADQVDEVDSTQSNDEPMQPTVEQANSMKTPFFHDMYLSQPKDEEGWQEMEYEAGLQKQQEFTTRVNGLTQDEWNDLCIT